MDSLDVKNSVYKLIADYTSDEAEELGPRYHNVLVERYVNERSVEDISEIMGLPVDDIIYMADTGIEILKDRIIRRFNLVKRP